MELGANRTIASVVVLTPAQDRIGDNPLARVGPDERGGRRPLSREAVGKLSVGGITPEISRN
jgi:hypothetical protein